MRRAHVVGAGLAGLSAAISLTQAGFRVTLSEASRRAGGRCRSYHDPKLDRIIDNGNHLVLSGNAAVLHFCSTIGSGDRLIGPPEARFAYMDLRDQRRWVLNPNRGRLPWWLLSKTRRVPGTKPTDYFALLKLLRAGPNETVGDLLSLQGPVWTDLLEGFLVSVLDTPAAEGSAALAGAVVRETLAKGGRACRPLVAEPTLAAAFIDPALAWLEARGASVRFGRRLRALELVQGAVVALDFADGRDAVAGEVVVLAVPSWVAAELVPGLRVPTVHHAILNSHFLTAPTPGVAPITGVVGGLAEWVFAFPDRLSTTTSAADHVIDQDREALAKTLWSEVAAVHRLDADMPVWQILVEKRATFAATPEQDRLRPRARTDWTRLFLAGDWTQTGLPATIEGAIRSGQTAAALAKEAGTD